MYAKEFQESLAAVEAAREANIAYEPARMTAEEKDALLAAYRKLDLERHFNQKRRLSRSNVVCVPECCLCYWQQHDQHLTVVSRSLDVKRAGLSDLVIVNRIALAQRCTTFTFHAVCPHIYTDSSKIARRS